MTGWTLQTSYKTLEAKYYTREEIDDLIAGGGGTTDYNALNNKPIDNYVLQNNLDCGAHNLTNINNIYTKTEVDEKILAIV